MYFECVYVLWHQIGIHLARLFLLSKSLIGASPAFCRDRNRNFNFSCTCRAIGDAPVTFLPPDLRLYNYLLHLLPHSALGISPFLRRIMWWATQFSTEGSAWSPLLLVPLQTHSSRQAAKKHKQTWSQIPVSAHQRQRSARALLLWIALSLCTLLNSSWLRQSRFLFEPYPPH